MSKSSILITCRGFSSSPLPSQTSSSMHNESHESWLPHSLSVALWLHFFSSPAQVLWSVTLTTFFLMCLPLKLHSCIIPAIYLLYSPILNQEKGNHSTLQNWVDKWTIIFSTLILQIYRPHSHVCLVWPLASQRQFIELSGFLIQAVLSKCSLLGILN